VIRNFFYFFAASPHIVAVNLVQNSASDPDGACNQRLRPRRRPIPKEFVLVLEVTCHQDRRRDEEHALPPFIHPGIIYFRFLFVYRKAAIRLA
jgi:hypothetical protein